MTEPETRAERRDFRFNALYVDIHGRLYDPTGEGVNDTMLFMALGNVFPRTLASSGAFTRAVAEAYNALGDRAHLPGDGW